MPQRPTATTPLLSRRSFGGLALGSLAGLARSARAAPTWRLATPYAEGNFQTLSTVIFAEEVARETSGRLVIDVYPNDSLLPAERILPAVMSGEIDLGEVQLAWLSPWVAAAEVDTVPFLATTYAEARQLWNASRQVFLRTFGRLNLVPLKAVPWPPVGLASRVPLGHVGDLAGRRFLVTSPITRGFAQAVGALPVELPPAQAGAAFAQGQFDALFAPVVEGLGRFQAPSPLYYYDVGAWLPKNAVVMSNALYETLSSADQGLLIALAEASEERAWEASRQEYERRLVTLANLGATVETPSPALMDGLREIGNRLALDWLARAGFDGEDILRAYRI